MPLGSSAHPVSFRRKHIDKRQLCHTLRAGSIADRQPEIHPSVIGGCRHSRGAVGPSFCLIQVSISGFRCGHIGGGMPFHICRSGNISISSNVIQHIGQRCQPVCFKSGSHPGKRLRPFSVRISEGSRRRIIHVLRSPYVAGYIHMVGQYIPVADHRCGYLNRNRNGHTVTRRKFSRQKCQACRISTIRF